MQQQQLAVPQLELFNRLIQPIWIFDFVEERNRWVNTAGLELWASPSLEEFCGRDRKQNRSASTFQKLQQAQAKIEKGGHVSLHWTLYPKGVAKTVHITVTGIQLDLQNDNQDDHYCMLFHAVPVETDKLLERQSLRGVEMLRHLPMAVCQFDLKGTIMFENQWAQIQADVDTNGAEKKNDVNVEEKTDAMGSEKGTTNDINKKSASSSNAANNVKGSMEESSKGSTKKPTTENENHEQPTSNSATDTAADTSKTLGHDFIRRFIDPDVAMEALKAIQNTTDQVIQLEAELVSSVHADNHRTSEWSQVSLRKTTDPVTGQTVILYSAQDKSDAQTAIKERAASVHKSEFLAIMAHEIRTPLHQVIGFVDLLDQSIVSSPTNKEQKGYIKLLQQSAQGLMTVINDVLDYSKLEAGEMKIERIPHEPLSVVEGSLAAVKASCQEKGLSLLPLDWDKEIPFRVLGDPNRTRQILLNLLSNAVKFTSRGGSIQVEGTVVKRGDASVPHQLTSELKETSTAQDKWIKITVRDTGVGISEKNQELVFQKYQQATLSVARNHGGTGLGLSICQRLVHCMGGAIGVYSCLGKGSSFWFMLPAQEPEKPKPSVEPLLSHAKNGQSIGTKMGFNILVAEDNLVNQKLIKNMLKRLGHQSTIAGNGQIAIDMLGENTTSNTFDLVLLDIQMPVMDGVEATRRLRTMGFSDLPILALTASVKQHDYRELGFDDWLPKPTPLKELKEKILRSKQVLVVDNQ